MVMCKMAWSEAGLRGKPGATSQLAVASGRELRI
jgi:hypothetical protein